MPYNRLLYKQAILDLINLRIRTITDPNYSNALVVEDVAETLSLALEQYVTAGLKAVRVATTGAINLAAPGAAIDGVTLSSISVQTNGDIGDRVLVKDQVAQQDNGIYLFKGAGVPMVRASDSNESSEFITGQAWFVTDGAVNGLTAWVLTTIGTIILGSTPLTFAQLGTSSITLTGDVTGSGSSPVATTISNNAVTNAKFRQSSGVSVVGKFDAGTGNVADIVSTVDDQFLVRRSGALTWGTIQISDIPSLTTLYVPIGRTITINGVTQDLSANRTWNVGTVTSVGLSLPVSVFSVSGSPVTGSGTLTAAFANQSANTVFAGPTAGGAAVPTFRTLVAGDLPSAAFENFANTNLTQTANRTYDGNNASYTFNNLRDWVFNFVVGYGMEIYGSETYINPTDGFGGALIHVLPTAIEITAHTTSFVSASTINVNATGIIISPDSGVLTITSLPNDNTETNLLTRNTSNGRVEYRTVASLGIPAPGSYILNQTTQQASSNFNIDGVGVIPTLYGSTASGGNLTIGSTSHATKGAIYIGYDIATTVHIGQSGATHDLLKVGFTNFVVTNSAVSVFNATHWGVFNVPDLNIANATDAIVFRAGSQPEIESGFGYLFNTQHNNGDTFIIQSNANSNANIFIVRDTSTAANRLVDIRNNTTSVFRIEGAANALGAGAIFAGNVPHATVDTDKFLVLDSDYIKYRTGSELLSDIGGVGTTSGAFIQNQFASEQVASGNILGRLRISSIDIGNYYLDIGRVGTGVYNRFRVGSDSTLRVEQDQFAGITFDGSGTYYGGLRFITMHAGVSTVKFDIYDGIRQGWISNVPTYFAYFWDINTVEKMRLSNAGNLMLGVSTDNGIRLQVKGSALTNAYFLDTGVGNSYIQIANSNGYDFKLGVEGSGIVAFKSAVGWVFTNFLYGHSSGNIAVGTTVPSVWSGTNSIQVKNGTAPSSSFTDGFYIYSSDVAGSAVPSFRTEAGTVVKLYPEAVVTKAQEIADRLTSQGLLTAGSVILNNDIVLRTIADVNDSPTSADYVLEYTSLTDDRIVTLFDPSTYTNRVLIVKDGSGQAGTYGIFIDDGGYGIDGASMKSINTNYGRIALYSNGSTWRVLYS